MANADLNPTTYQPAAELLGLPEVRDLVHRVSVERYHELTEQDLIDRKTELIRGVIVDKMSQSPLHCSIVQVLTRWLFRGLGDEWLIRSANPVTTTDSEPEPDVSVVRGGVTEFLTRHPTTGVLAIEVAVSSEKLDRQKATIYAEADIDEYWIVLAERQSVEVYTKPKDGRYTNVSILDADEILRPMAFADLQLPVADLFPPAS